MTTAKLKWWRQAKFGLFIHYGLYSLLGRGEWALNREQLDPAEYARLASEFAASRFDAEAIAELRRLVEKARSR